MSQEQEILDAQRVKAFVEDPAVVSALDRLKDRYVADFVDSTTPEAREIVHARLRALADIRQALTVVIHTGIVAAEQKAQSDKRAEQAKKYQKAR